MKYIRFVHTPFRTSNGWGNNFEILDGQKEIGYGRLKEKSEWVYCHIISNGCHYMADIRKKTFLSFSVDSIIEAAENNYTLQQEIYSQSEDWREQNEIAYWNDYAM